MKTPWAAGLSLVLSTLTFASVTTATSVPEPVGQASPISPGVEVRSGGATGFSPLAGAVDVATGDAVKTDATGFAEIAYHDGSRTRLDVDTEFTVVELTTATGRSTTRTSMGLGRTWHRVQDLGAGGSAFSVETSQATAVVTGTAFGISCATPDSCSYLVVEGSIELTLADGSAVPLEAPAAVSVTAGVPGPISPLPWDGVFADPWFVDNAARDVLAGFAAPADVFAAHGPAFGSLTGTFTGTRTFTTNDCLGPCPASDPPIGDVAERSYTFSVDCSTIPCTATVDVQFLHDGELRNDVVPLTFDGTTYGWSVAYENPGCWWDDDGDGTTDRVTGVLASTGTWSLAPTAGDIRDGAWTIVALEGGGSFVNELSGAPDGCADGSRGTSNASTITVSR